MLISAGLAKTTRPRGSMVILYFRSFAVQDKRFSAHPTGMVTFIAVLPLWFRSFAVQDRY